MSLKSMPAAIFGFSLLAFCGLELRAEDAVEAVTAIKTQAPGNVFADSDAPSFSLSPQVKSPAISYEVKDWRGQSVLKGLWSGPSETPLKIEGLARGYYTLSAEAEGARLSGQVPFSIVVDPAKRVPNPDAYFAIDTAQSEQAANWKNKRNPKNVPLCVAELDRLLGVPIIRDRMHWPDIAKDPYELNWGGLGLNLKLLQERGIQVMPMFESSPSWAKSDAKAHIPDNLFALYEFSKSCASSFKGTVSACEFQNEQDIGRKMITAWDFAAAQKAAYLGLKEGNPDIKVPVGAFCRYPLPNYCALTLENGLADYFDVYNFHIYNRLPEYPGIVSDLKAMLSKYGAGERPIWITENGTRYDGAGKLDTHIPGMKEHDPDQELILAEFVLKSQIILQNLGIQRDFLFMLVPYNEQEGTKVWGIINWNYIAKPAFAAFANLTYQLSNAKILGSFDAAPGVKAFLYERPDGTQTLVFWSESELDKADREKTPIDVRKDFAKDFSLKAKGGFMSSLFGSPKPRLSDAFGKESEIEPANGELTLHATRFPSFLSGLKGLEPSAPALSAGKPCRPDPSKDLSVVIKAVLTDKLSCEMNSCATLKGGSSEIFIDVFNFSDDAKTGRIEAVGNGFLEGFPANVSLQPREKLRIKAKYIPKSPSGSGFMADLRLKGSFNGKETSPFYMPVFCLYNLEADTAAKLFEFAKPERWRKNSSGEMSVSYDEAEKAVKFHVDFKKDKNFWAYPEYDLNPATESLKGAVGVSFEIKASQKDNSKGYNDNQFMAVTESVHETGKAVYIPYPAPSTEWKKMLICFKDAPDGFKPESVKMLRVGMNPATDELDFWVRDMKVLYSK